MSLPVRECGLKSAGAGKGNVGSSVTPCAGEWIEMHLTYRRRCFWEVTPSAGEWIEITSLTERVKEARSLPVRECGLKS